MVSPDEIVEGYIRDIQSQLQSRYCLEYEKPRRHYFKCCLQSLVLLIIVSS